MTCRLAAKEEKGQTSMKFLLKKLSEVGMIRCDGTVEDECALHPNGSHSSVGESVNPEKPLMLPLGLNICLLFAMSMSRESLCSAGY